MCPPIRPGSSSGTGQGRLLGKLTAGNVEHRVDPLAIHHDFIVQVGARDLSRGPDGGDELATLDLVADAHVELGRMGEPAHEAVAMVDLERAAVPAVEAGLDHDPWGRSDDREPERAGEIESRV